MLERISKSPEEDKEAGRVERSQGSSLDDIPIGRGSGAAKVATQTWNERIAKVAADENIPTHIAMQRARRLYPEAYQAVSTVWRQYPEINRAMQCDV